MLGTAVSGMASTFGVMATILSGVGTAIGLLGSLLGALLSPIGLVIAGITALAAKLITSTDVGTQALDFLKGAFGELKDEALGAFQGIADALAAGDISLAAKILWLSLKLEWQKGVNALNQVWVKVKDFFLTTFSPLGRRQFSGRRRSPRMPGPVCSRPGPKRSISWPMPGRCSPPV